jgi:16S rRNA processing protein RimM
LNDLHETNRRWVLVARILRPRGNKGEVVAELLTDFSSRFSTLKQIYLRKDDGEPQSATLQHFWVDRNHPEMGIFQFTGYTTISEAEKLRGFEVLLRFEERVVLPAGQYFVTDLIGCTVLELPGDAAKRSSPARVLGVVRDVLFTGETVAGTPLLQVETPGGELLLPLAEDICKRIDVAGRRIDVRLPEGLEEVNASER